MSTTLPPGWTGNGRGHHTRIGGFRAEVWSWPRSPAPGRGTDFSWFVKVNGTASVLASNTDGRLTAPEARTAALTALQTLLTTATAAVSTALANLNHTEP